MIKSAIVGFGGIAQAHKQGYMDLYSRKGNVELVAVCDIDSKKFDGNIKINIDVEQNESEHSYNTYTDIEQMLKNEDLDMIDICLPTYMHKNMAIDMLKRGYNVLCEKPMGRTYADCLEMLQAAKDCNKQIMIGQCLHFTPEYEYLKDIVDNNSYGKPVSGFFQRLSSPPTWGWENWYMDDNKSGGCIQDLHIHDIDFIKYIFGNPKNVSCYSKDGFAKWDVVHSQLNYNDFSVTAIGDWSTPKHPFEYSYRMRFEKATVCMNMGEITVYPLEGDVFKPDIKPESGYMREIEYFANLLENNDKNIKNPPEESAKSVKLVETLRKSSDNNGEKILFD